MAVKAEFQADFRSFIAAVESADQSLIDFGKGASAVQTKLDRMVDNFSGRKVIQDATLMVEAVERVGGASNLTAKELERIGSTAAEAAAKMRALGVDVPDKIADLAKHAKTANSGFQDMIGTVKNLALGFVALFSAQTAISFVKGIFDSASALKDLSAQTQINVEDLQHLAGAMSEFGVDADQLGRGLYGLGKRIAGGDESVDAALRQMGLSLSALQGLQGEELFLTIERGLATLQGTLRDDVSAALFGDKLGAAMAGAAGDIDATLAKARELNTVVSGESVDAMDQFGEAIARAQTNLTNIAANMAGPIAQGFNALIDVWEKGASKWDIGIAVLRDYAAAATNHLIPGVTASATHLATLIDHTNRAKEATTQATAATIAWEGPLVQTAAAKKVAATAAAELTKQDNLWLEGLKAANAEAELFASVLANQVKTATEQTAEADKRATAALTTKTDAISATIIANGLQRNADAATTTSANDLTTAWGRMQAALQTLEKQKKGDIDITASQKKIYDEFTDQMLADAEAADKETAAFWKARDAIKAKGDEVEVATKKTGVYMNQLKMLVTDPKLAAFFGDTAQGAVATTLYGGGANRLTPEMAAAMAAGQFINTAGVGAVQRRAVGGPVNAGQPYLVGERGPELFVPGRSGAITPGGGAPAITINITQPLGSPDAIARAVGDALTARSRATGIRL